MAREKNLKELGKYVQDCECGMMIAKRDCTKGRYTCPRCGNEDETCDAVKKDESKS